VTYDKNMLVLISDLQRVSELRQRYVKNEDREKLLQEYQLTPEEYHACMDYEDNIALLNILMGQWAHQSLANFTNPIINSIPYQRNELPSHHMSDIFKALFNISFNQEIREQFQEDPEMFSFDGYMLSPNEKSELQNIFGDTQSKGEQSLEPLTQDMQKEMSALEALLA